MSIGSKSEDWVDLSHLGNKEPGQEEDNLSQSSFCLQSPGHSCYACTGGRGGHSAGLHISDCQLGEQGTMFCHFVIESKLHRFGFSILAVLLTIASLRHFFAASMLLLKDDQSADLEWPRPAGLFQRQSWPNTLYCTSYTL